MKEQNSFTTDLLHLTLDSGDHDQDGTVMLLRDFVSDYAQDHGIAYDDAARQLSHMPDYECQFGAALLEQDGLMLETFTYPDSDRLISLRSIIDAIENGVDGWLATDSALAI